MQQYLLIALICVGVIGALTFAFSFDQEQSLQPNTSQPTNDDQATLNDDQATLNDDQATLMEDTLKIEDIKVGEGREAKAGDTVFVHYTGTFTDGRKFDSSRDRGEPFSFVLGKGMVIQGWDQGVAGMKIGGLRKLTIPSSLGYGERGVPGAIPPNSILLFDVELLDIK